MTDVATCRHCGLELKGTPYWKGGNAYHPRTGEQCKVNFYGGYVCSPECDYGASLALERTMPGHGASQKTIGCFASQSFKSNWPDR